MFFKVVSLQLLNSHTSMSYHLFTFSCTFTGQGANYRKRIVFQATRNKLTYEGATAKLFQLICEVVQIVSCCHFWGFIYLLHVDHRVCIAVKNRLPQLAQILVKFDPSLGCYISSNCHVQILP